MANNTLTYGFQDLAGVMEERLTTIGERQIYDAVSASVGEYTRQMNELMASLVTPTTFHKERFKLPGSGTLQPLDDNGNPLPVREEGYYDVAYPIQGGGTAWGDNRVARALMTVADANRRTLESMKRDADWVRRHILAALFYEASWTYTDDLFGSLTIECLANGDSVTYLKRGGSTATDDHYLAQANSIDDDNNPFDDIYDELMEHLGNEPPVVVWVPNNLKTSIKALTNFYEEPDPDITLGSASDELTGQYPVGFGDEVLGKVDKCWIVEWRALPDNYMIAHAVGAGPVLKMRQYEAAELQGFFAEEHSPDGNRNEYRMIRYAGFGVFNRIAALVYRIGNGSYAEPTGYDTLPLAV